MITVIYLWKLCYYYGIIHKISSFGWFWFLLNGSVSEEDDILVKRWFYPLCRNTSVRFSGGLTIFGHRIQKNIFNEEYLSSLQPSKPSKYHSNMTSKYDDFLIQNVLATKDIIFNVITLQAYSYTWFKQCAPFIYVNISLLFIYFIAILKLYPQTLKLYVQYLIDMSSITIRCPILKWCV